MSTVAADTETVGVFAEILCFFDVVVAEHIARVVSHPVHRVVKAVESPAFFIILTAVLSSNLSRST